MKHIVENLHSYLSIFWPCPNGVQRIQRTHFSLTSLSLCSSVFREMKKYQKDFSSWCGECSREKKERQRSSIASTKLVMSVISLQKWLTYIQDDFFYGKLLHSAAQNQNLKQRNALAMRTIAFCQLHEILKITILIGFHRKWITLRSCLVNCTTVRSSLRLYSLWPRYNY